MLKRICRLLLPDERKMGIRVVCAVFLCALLDFAGLAALLPVLFFLLDDGRDKDAALLFLLLTLDLPEQAGHEALLLHVLVHTAPVLPLVHHPARFLQN